MCKHFVVALLASFEVGWLLNPCTGRRSVVALVGVCRVCDRHIFRLERSVWRQLVIFLFNDWHGTVFHFDTCVFMTEYAPKRHP